MLGKASIETKKETIRYANKLSNLPLNSSQTDAVNSAISRNLTFIWGPPGTGKTSVIGAIMYELYKCGLTVLIVYLVDFRLVPFSSCSKLLLRARSA